MEPKKISRYIHFGAIYRFLKDAREGWSLHGKDWILNNIKLFFDFIEEFNLPVTQRASFRLREFKDKMEKSDSDHALTADEANELNEIMRDLEKTLGAESQGNIAFIVTDKRIDVNKLLSNISSLMAPNVFNSLPNIASYDFGEAGKCIAFERPTAAAFHLLRGTEAVLRHFYCSIVKRGHVKLLWKNMIEHLERRKKSPPKELLRNLDNIRDSYRNPTQHPDKIYDIQEVQDLFGLCIDVVNRMMALLR